MIGPGDLLVCVDASPGYRTGKPVGLTRGSLYLCEVVETPAHWRCDRDQCGTSITVRGGITGLCPGRFRPYSSTFEADVESRARETNPA